MSTYSHRDRGDTVIELVLAFGVFALVAVTTLGIMNRGIATSQRSLETTLVRQQMDSQAEALRFIRDNSDTYATVWSHIVSQADSVSLLPLSPPACPVVSELSGPANGFFVDYDAGGNFSLRGVDATTYRQAETYARVDFDTGISEGVWVQVARASLGDDASDTVQALNAYDFYIHACWDAPGQDHPMTLGTIVRLYER